MCGLEFEKTSGRMKNEDRRNCGYITVKDVYHYTQIVPVTRTELIGLSFQTAVCTQIAEKI